MRKILGVAPGHSFADKKKENEEQKYWKLSKDMKGNLRCIFPTAISKSLQKKLLLQNPNAAVSTPNHGNQVFLFLCDDSRDDSFTKKKNEKIVNENIWKV